MRGVVAPLVQDIQAVKHGITVNGLPILEDYLELDIFFRDNVIGGPGAFYSPANTFSDFNIAVRKKLIREIAGVDDGRASRVAAAKAPPP